LPPRPFLAAPNRTLRLTCLTDARCVHALFIASTDTDGRPCARAARAARVATPCPPSNPTVCPVRQSAFLLPCWFSHWCPPTCSNLLAELTPAPPCQSLTLLLLPYRMPFLCTQSGLPAQKPLMQLTPPSFMAHAPVG
jgi:hypothetical protein